MTDSSILSDSHKCQTFSCKEPSNKIYTTHFLRSHIASYKELTYLNTSGPHSVNILNQCSQVHKIPKLCAIAFLSWWLAFLQALSKYYQLPKLCQPICESMAEKTILTHNHLLIISAWSVESWIIRALLFINPRSFPPRWHTRHEEEDCNTPWIGGEGVQANACL